MDHSKPMMTIHESVKQCLRKYADFGGPRHPVTVPQAVGEFDWEVAESRAPYTRTGLCSDQVAQAQAIHDSRYSQRVISEQRRGPCRNGAGLRLVSERSSDSDTLGYASPDPSPFPDRQPMGVPSSVHAAS